MSRSLIWTGKVAKFMVLAITLIVMVFPLYWIVITSFKRSTDIFKFPLEYWPTRFSLENYDAIFKDFHFQNYMLNSLLVAMAAAFIVLVIASLSGYVLARFRFRTRGFLILAFFLTQVIPTFIGLAPLYLLMSNLGLINQLSSLVIMYTVLLIPFSTLMLRGFFERVPAALEEAALMDGCNRLTALWRVVIPVMLPGLAATFIFAFVQNWNELFFAIMFIDSDQSRTIPVAMNSLISTVNIDWGPMSAAAVVSILPTLVMFAVAQKYIVAGLTQGATKE